MNMMARTMASNMAKYITYCIIIILLSCVVWFLGPYVAVMNVAPLAPFWVRVMVIFFVIVFSLFWLFRWPLSIPSCVLVCVMIWAVGPELSMGNSHPLQPEWARLLITVLVISAFFLYWGYKLFTAIKNDSDFLNRIIRKKEENAVENEEISEIGEVVKSAVSRLKELKTQGKSFFYNRKYLYDLPWYMIIGSPGAGKSSFVYQSGLNFPLSEQIAKGVSAAGTKNCDWWFTNEAVILDTAGRYTTQGGLDSNHPVQGKNATEWLTFLSLLKKNRAQAPINGVFLTVSVASLLEKDEAIFINEIANYRQRLADLRKVLGIEYPVYLMVSKLDLLKGFSEYFSYLTTDSRSQVLGFTLPYAKQKNAFFSRKEAKDTIIKDFISDEFAKLAARLADGLDSRLHEEYDLTKRKYLYQFPSEFLALQERLLRLVELVFGDSIYDRTLSQHALRGVYFSSVSQTGGALTANSSTVNARFNRAYHDGAERSSVALGGQRKDFAVQGKKSFFTVDFFFKLVLEETNLVKPNRRWERRFRLFNLLAHAFIVVCLIAFLLAVVNSFSNNHSLLQEAEKNTHKVVGLLNQYETTKDPVLVPKILQQTKDIPGNKSLSVNDSPYGYGMGMYSYPMVKQATDATYLKMQKEFLLPHIASRIEKQLESALTKKDSTGVYQNLRVYLMLYDHDGYNAKDLISWMEEDWRKTADAQIFGGHDLMMIHLGQIFKEKSPVSPNVPQNVILVEKARGFLSINTSVDRLYQRSMAAMLPSAPQDFNILTAAGPQARLVLTRASGESLEKGIHGIYTYDGYHQVFNKRLPEFIALAKAEDDWVMGKSSAKESFQGVGSLNIQQRMDAAVKDPVTQEIRRRYLNEYYASWQDLINDIRTVQGVSLQGQIQILKTYSSPDSPLNNLLRAIIKEVSLSKKSASDLKNVASNQLNQKISTKLSSNTGSISGAVLGQAITNLNYDLEADRRLAKSLVDDRFSALREVVTGELGGLSSTQPSGGDRSGLQNVNSVFNNYYSYLVLADNALSTNSNLPAQDAVIQMQIEGSKLPAPIGGILLDLANQGAREINTKIGVMLNAQMEASVGATCRSMIEGKYPFENSEQEVSAYTFAYVFAQDGLLDRYFNASLAKYVDTSLTPWQYKKFIPGAPEIPGPSLESFQAAVEIRDLFFGSQEGKTPRVPLSVQLLDVDPRLDSLTLDLNGQVLKYEHGPKSALNIAVPSQNSILENSINIKISNKKKKDDGALSVSSSGAWGVFRLLEKGTRLASSSNEVVVAKYTFQDDISISLGFLSSAQNPLRRDVFKRFKCPRGGRNV